MRLKFYLEQVHSLWFTTFSEKYVVYNAYFTASFFVDWINVIQEMFFLETQTRGQAETPIYSLDTRTRGHANL